MSEKKSVLEEVSMFVNQGRKILMDQINAGRQALNPRKAAEQAQLKELAMQANECMAMITDPRYPSSMAFLDGVIKDLREALQVVLVRDVKSMTKADTLTKAMAIASQIEAYSNIRRRADRVMEQYETYRKLIEKDEVENEK
jgi:hypothetical protein